MHGIGHLLSASFHNKGEKKGFFSMPGLDPATADRLHGQALSWHGFQVMRRKQNFLAFC